MPNSLRITADIEDDSTVGLLAKVSSDGFAGYGEAWFNVSEVEDFIRQLRDFIETRNNPPHLVGGNWNKDGTIAEVLLSMRFYALSSFRSGVHIELAQRPSTDSRPEEVERVVVELKPNVHELMDFCDDLEKLLANTLSEALLTIDPSITSRGTEPLAVL